ncbi:UDP-N-acetylmuramate dehydrogenase [Candidatus Parcubacteria bacterium]|nr:UDP-N-acetylmuramate dehydrogenase [Candidatus Parcubacteria bacterium]
MLKDFTTFKIGGPARILVRVSHVDELKSLNFVRDKYFILGGGSNVLFADEGFDGTVIKIEILDIELQGSTLIAGAGESWDGVVKYAVEKNLWGLENLSGIPGTVGGAVAGSIGAYGQSLSQTLSWVEVFDVQTGEIKRLNNQDCEFGYRESIFSKNSAQVIIRAAFLLSQIAKPDLSYKDLSSLAAASIQEIREAVLEIRKNKFPDLAVEGTAGSFFKNPVVGKEEAIELQKKYPDMPTFVLPETGQIKIPLAWLLDHVLNIKGMRMGGARLFEKQPLVIVADKNCSSKDVITLSQFVQTQVKENFKIIVEPEVKII